MVVVADDSISVRKFVGRMLEKAGYRVKLASDGLEASEIVAQIGCHLLITDLEMPRMNGYELMAHSAAKSRHAENSRARGHFPRRRQASRSRHEGRRSGAFLTKPVQEDQLVSDRRRIDRRRKRRRNAALHTRAGAAGLT